MKDLTQAYLDVRDRLEKVALGMAKGRQDWADEFRSIGSLAFMEAAATFRADCGSFANWASLKTAHAVRAHQRVVRRQEATLERMRHKPSKVRADGNRPLEFMALLSDDARELARCLMVEAMGDVRYALIRAKEYLYGTMGRRRFERALDEIKRHLGVC